MPAKIANAPGPIKIAPTAKPTRTRPVMNAVGTSRPGPPRSGSPPTSIAVGSCQLGPPKPSAPTRTVREGSASSAAPPPPRGAEALGTHPDRARGLGFVGRTLLAQELGDRDLLGGLWRPRLDLHLVPDGLGEVVGRGLDGLDVRRVLRSLRHSLWHDLDLCRLGLLDQLGHTGLVAGKVDVPSRAGLGALVDVVPLRLGLEHDGANLALLLLDAGLGRRLLGRERLLADGRFAHVRLGRRRLLVLGFWRTVLRPGLERHGRGTRCVGFTLRLLGVPARRLVAARPASR